MPTMPEKTRIPQQAASSDDDPDTILRRLVTEAIRHCPKKRAQIAEELTSLLGLRVTEHMLNDFTSTRKKPARFPAVFIAPLCQITGDDSLQRFVMGAHLRKLVEFGERELAGFRSQREREALRDELLEAVSLEPPKKEAAKP